MKNVLVVDDEDVICWALQRALSLAGHNVDVCATAENALDSVQKQTPDVVVMDVRLPGMDGLTALEHLQNRIPDTPVIVITAHGNLETAVQAVEGGAFDYLTKPFDLSQAVDTVTRALQRAPVDAESPRAENRSSSEELVGRSPAMQMVFKRIALVTSRDAPVLITGESGTGKELVARAIHRHSKRRHGPFLPIHVAALNPSLVESELFGHVQGAFTGASEDRAGLLELAEGGTVFFDELGDIPMPLQVKLLRALEANEVFPVGSNKPHPLNIRILAATHHDLQRRMAEELFRHDLYFRLNVFQIEIPPLRERMEDVELLAAHFLQRLDENPRELAEETREFLKSQPWYGNVRELRNALEHAAIIARGDALLPDHFPRLEHPATLRSTHDQLQQDVRTWLAEQVRERGEDSPEELHSALLAITESALLEDVMKRVKGNRWVAAQWLGLNRATVRKKLTTYGLTDVHEEED